MHHRGSNFRVLRCVYSMLSFVVSTLMFSSFFFSVCSCYFSSELALIIYLIFSAALNRRPYDCMHSAGEDGGLERVFIKRLTNTNCVAEKRSTAAYIVSYCMARFTFTTCLNLPEITRISIHSGWFRGRRVGWGGGVRRRGVTVWRLRGCGGIMPG